MPVARSLAAVLAACGAAALAGCGFASPDLFVITRGGEIPGAHLTLLVNDDGTARCNGRSPVDVTSAELLAARDIARVLQDDERRRLTLAPGPSTVLTYRVRGQYGTVSFSDTSRGLRPRLLRVEALTREIALGDCRLRR